MPPVAILPETTRETKGPRERTLRRHGLIVYSVDLGSASNYPFSREAFTLREDAQRLIADVRAADPELAKRLRIEERELKEGG